MTTKSIPKSKIDKFYVLYKGDTVVSSGTIEEINKKTDIPISHLIWLTTPTAGKREANSKGNRMVMVEG